MSQIRNPEQHVNEEPRNDFMDLMKGFGGFFGFLFLIFVVGVVIKLMID
ncbi:YqzM family protein [Paenibacillus sp. KN14-4R]